MYSRLIRRKWHCKVIPKALLLTFGREYYVCGWEGKFSDVEWRYVLYIHNKKYSECKIIYDRVCYRTSLHWYHLLYESNEKRIQDIRILPYRPLTAFNGTNLQCFKSVESGLWTIIWMRLWNFAFSTVAVARKFRLTSSEIRCDPRLPAFRVRCVIYNFHEIFTRRSRMPAKPRYSRNFANLTTLNAFQKSHSFSFYRVSELSELIKCDCAKTQFSPCCLQCAFWFQINVRWQNISLVTLN